MSTRHIIATIAIGLMAVVIIVTLNRAQAPLAVTDQAVSYTSSAMHFSLKYPTGYTVSESGSTVAFTIPTTTTSGTNLSSDTHISVESSSPAGECTANLFFDQGVVATTITDRGTTYSVASSTGAGAGNRYEETIYALRGTSPCVAVRYLIHYGVIENYPAGTVREFDKQALLRQFDAIRESLKVVKSGPKG